ncbi:hypothetical protein G9A89_000362, partial [Geosiphon pyriformis]
MNLSDSDASSLASSELFDAPKGPPLAKPLLQAALRAREEAERNQQARTGDPSKGDHLAALNQPLNLSDSDDSSLASSELFDAPKGPPPPKPLLQAALRAREEAERNQQARTGDPCKGDHLAKLNQPLNLSDSDDSSLASSELFDAPKGPPPAKPLLQAAIRAREEAERNQQARTGDPSKGDHLATLNQPSNLSDSDMSSLASSELFDAPKGPPPAKPLLQAAIRAREEAERNQQARTGDPSKGDHLATLNQPSNLSDSDDSSLASSELFDAPKGPPPPKPLLQAAIRAREQAERSAKARTGDPSKGDHLAALNQPMNLSDSDA